MKLSKEAVKSCALAAFVRWLLLAVLVGLAAGAAGVLFHFALERCQEWRLEYPWLLYLLPLGGLAIVGMYRRWGKECRLGTDMVLVAVRDNCPVPGVTAPLIFLSTAITHLLGGSAGREGAALQLGGSIASILSRPLGLGEKDSRVLVMCGTAAAFAALFGTPAAAAVFALELVSVGIMYYSAIVPCMAAALTGYLLAGAAGIAPTAFPFAAPAPTALPLLQAAALGVLCGGVSILFWFSMHKTGDLLARWLPNPYLRIALGGAGVVLLTLLVGTRDYNGAGMDVILRATQGNVRWWDFLLKILFTAITLGVGFKGGEIVPTFFVGATFGCVAGGLLGLDPAFGAALGLVAVFCGVTNCPLTSIILGVELFGGEGLLFYCVVCAVSYMLSGYCSLYGEQRIMYSKTKAEFIGGLKKG